jgi:peptide/nickel transport system permease protein
VAPTSSTALGPAAAAQASRPRRLFWRRFRRHRPALISAVVLVILFALVFLAPWLTGYEFDAIDTKQIRKPPTAAHVMGTDELGRDLFTRVLYGGRISMTIGLFSALVATLVGTLLGAVAGYYGGLVDNLIMRATDIVFTIPALPLLIILNSYADSSIPLMVLVIGALSWMGTARAVRGMVLSLKEQDFLLAARAVGVGDGRILLFHLIPNALTPVIVGATLGVGNAIIVESSLSFLGLGITPPTPSWGNMLQDAQSTMLSAPWLTIFPGLAILLTVLCVNFLGDGLRDGLDPRLRTGEGSK